MDTTVIPVDLLRRVALSRGPGVFVAILEKGPEALCIVFRREVKEAIVLFDMMLPRVYFEENPMRVVVAYRDVPSFVWCLA